MRQAELESGIDSWLSCTDLTLVRVPMRVEFTPLLRCQESVPLGPSKMEGGLVETTERMEEGGSGCRSVRHIARALICAFMWSQPLQTMEWSVFNDPRLLDPPKLSPNDMNPLTRKHRAETRLPLSEPAS